LGVGAGNRLLDDTGDAETAKDVGEPEETSIFAFPSSDTEFGVSRSSWRCRRRRCNSSPCNLASQPSYRRVETESPDFFVPFLPAKREAVTLLLARRCATSDEVRPHVYWNYESLALERKFPSLVSLTPALLLSSFLLAPLSTLASVSLSPPSYTMDYQHHQSQQPIGSHVRQQSQVPDIHSVPRVAFPVLSEPFLVDSNYEFVKELGQGTYTSLFPLLTFGERSGAVK